MKAALACGVFLAALGFSASVAARPRVLLIHERPDDPFIERVRAELAELDVELVDRNGSGPLDAAARREGAAAAIRLLPTQNGVEVWMADATSGRSLLRHLIVDESRSGPNQTLVALQTAELLRTSLLFERHAAPAAERPEDAAPERDDTTVAISPQKRKDGRAPSVQASLGALYSPGGAGVALQLGASLRWPIDGWLGLAFDLGVPVQSAEIDGPEGSATLGAYLLGVGLAAHARAEPQLFGAAGLCAGLLRVSADAEPAEPLDGDTDAVFRAATYVWGDGSIGVAPWLHIGARVVAGLALPRVNVEFAGNRAGTWGAPFLGAFALAEVPLR